MKTVSTSISALLCVWAATAMGAADHVVISEILMDAPNDNITTFESNDQSSEFVEIYNPTAAPIDISNYYISDYPDYGLLPGGTLDLDGTGSGIADYMLKFPNGTVLPAGGIAVVTLDAQTFFATGFSNTQFGGTATGYAAQAGSPLLFEIKDTDAAVPEMVNLKDGHLLPTTFAKTNSGEFVTLFEWDNTTDDLVKDVDSVRYAGPSSGNQPKEKSTLGAIDGPDVDTDASSYLVDGLAAAWDFAPATDPDCIQRITADETGEITTGGNGIGGHDETTEELLNTFVAVSQTEPTPGLPHPDLGPPAAVNNWSVY